VNEVRALYERAATLDPDSQLTVVNYGNFLIETGGWREAETLLEDYLARRPGSAYAWYNLGLAHRLGGRYDQAVEAFRRATEVDPLARDAWVNLIIMLLERDRIDEARQTVRRMRDTGDTAIVNASAQLFLRTEKRAVEIDPSNAEAWRKLTLGLLEMGQYDKARDTVAQLRAVAGGGLRALADDLDARINKITAEIPRDYR